MDLRRTTPLLLALACLCAGAAPAAAQTRDTIKPQPPLTSVPGVPSTQQPPKEQPPADTPATQQPAPSRPTIQLPNVRLPVRPRTVAVPSLAGRTEADARRLLTGAGLTLGSVSRLPVDRPAGTIFLQRPAAGTQVQRGSSVSITLAQAAAPAPAPVRTATVPDVTGQSLTTAVRRIEAAGLRVGSVEGASGSTARVSRQSSAAGQTVPRGTAIGLSMTAPAAPVVVATRPPAPPARPPAEPEQPSAPPAQPPAQPGQPSAEPQAPPAATVDSLIVPDVGRLTLADARNALAGAGFTASVDLAVADSTSWRVESQRPAAGARVPAGEDVALSLTAPPPAVAATEPAVVQPRVVEQPVRVAPVPAPRRSLPWLWMVLAVVAVAAAAAAARRWMRARATVAAAPVAVSARVRGEAGSRVEVAGAPFAPGAPRLRMRTREGAPELSVAAAGPLFTNHGGAGD